jgi:hypothetical protein
LQVLAVGSGLSTAIPHANAGYDHNGFHYYSLLVLEDFRVLGANFLYYFSVYPDYDRNSADFSSCFTASAASACRAKARHRIKIGAFCDIVPDETVNKV